METGCNLFYTDRFIECIRSPAPDLPYPKSYPHVGWTGIVLADVSYGGIRMLTIQWRSTGKSKIRIMHDWAFYGDDLLVEYLKVVPS